MVQKMREQLIFVYSCPKKEYNGYFRPNLRLSLLGILMGIFLLPNLAYLAAITPDNLINFTNQERKNSGLNILTANELLAKAAAEKGKAIMQEQNFSHTLNNQKFSSWIRAAGYNYSYVGENLAIDFSTSEGVMQAWENSPLHKKNLLSPYYSEIGVAIAAGKFQGQDTAVVVQIFGAPAVGSAEALTPNAEFSFLNDNSLLPEPSYASTQLYSAENLLTHSILKQESLPVNNNKLALAKNNISFSQTNKLIVQPSFYSSYGNMIMLLAFLVLSFSLVIIYRYYILKINRLLTI